MTDQSYAELEAKHAAFNERCAEELQEMNKNIIDNIVERGGSEGWDTTEDYLKRSFTFDSFEEAQAFCQGVRNFCNEKDHHPEWSTTDGGRTINVTLTSHFAGNKVTRLDFELAEAMNDAYSLTAGRHSMHPRFDTKQWASLKIGVGLFVLGSFIVKVATGSDYEERPQGPSIERPVPYHPRLVPEGAPLQAAAGTATAPEELLHYAYTELEKKPRAPPI